MSECMNKKTWRRCGRVFFNIQCKYSMWGALCNGRNMATCALWYCPFGRSSTEESTWPIRAPSLCSAFVVRTTADMRRCYTLLSFYASAKTLSRQGGIQDIAEKSKKKIGATYNLKHVDVTERLETSLKKFRTFAARLDQEKHVRIDQGWRALWSMCLKNGS